MSTKCLLLAVGLGLLTIGLAQKVSFEGLNMGKEETREFEKAARDAQELMEKLVRTDIRRREMFRCNSCVATAREILPALEQVAIDMKGRDRTWDRLSVMEEVCEDDGPMYGVQVFKNLEGKTYRVTDPEKEGITLYKSGTADGLMRGSWIIDELNGVCSTLVNDHYEVIGKQKTLRDIVRIGCRELTGFCKGRDYLLYLSDAERATISPEVQGSLSPLLNAISYKDEDIMKQLKCNACHTVSDSLDRRIDSFHADRVKKYGDSLDGKEQETVYLEELEGGCNKSLWRQYGFEYDWLEKKAIPDFVSDNGIQIKSEMARKFLFKTCDELVNDNFEVFLPWSTSRGKSKNRKPSKAVVCSAVCPKKKKRRKRVERDEL